MLRFDGMEDWHERMEEMFKNMINNRAEASEDEDQEVGDDFVVLENEEEAAGEGGEDNAGEGNVGDEVGELENYADEGDLGGEVDEGDEGDEDYEGDEGDEEVSDEDDEGDEGDEEVSVDKVVNIINAATYCLCKGPATNPMLQCDTCEVWYHKSCLILHGYLKSDHYWRMAIKQDTYECKKCAWARDNAAAWAQASSRHFVELAIAVILLYEECFCI